MSTSQDDPSGRLDTEIIELAKARNEEAFEALFEYYKFEIRRHVLSLVHNVDDTDELIQEVFFKVWRQLPTLRDNASFRPWLYRVATNQVLDHLRKKGNKADTFSLEDLDEQDIIAMLPDPGEYMSRVELTRLALATLPVKRRLCLLLKTQEGFSDREIAELLGIGESSVPTYVSYARRKFLEEYHRLEQEIDIDGKRR